MPGKPKIKRGSAFHERYHVMETGCWEWQGSLTRDGYGLIWRDGKVARAHRCAYEQMHGPIPAGMVVRHTCDNPPCCNPAHLILGTQLDNLSDMNRKGRHNTARGQDHTAAKLTMEQARTIRTRYARRETAGPKLAAEYGVTPTVIYNIVHGRSYREGA